MNPFEEALLEGEKRKAKESARNLLKLKKITDEEIADAVGLSMDELNVVIFSTLESGSLLRQANVFPA